MFGVWFEICFFSLCFGCICSSSDGGSINFGGLKIILSLGFLEFGVGLGVLLEGYFEEEKYRLIR